MFIGRPLMMGLAPQRGGGGERDLDLSLSMCLQGGKDMSAHSERAANVRALAPAPAHAGTLISDLWPPELWENKCPLLNPLGLWYFATATRAKTAA